MTVPSGYIDAHCHLHDERLVQDIDGICRRAAAVGVTHMITCATRVDNFHTTDRLSDRYGAVVPCYGIHPWFLDDLPDDWSRVLGEQVASTRGGVGETGLDFMDRRADRDRQISVFLTHLSLARDLRRPINIHIRKAWDALIHILKRNGPLTPPGVVHSFSGSADLARLLVGYGLYLSFSGSVTRPNAVKVIKALKAVPPDRFLLETDAPDLYPTVPSPDPRGLNEPANLPVIARIAADRTGMDRNVFVQQAYANACRVFAPLRPSVARSDEGARVDGINGGVVTHHAMKGG